MQPDHFTRNPIVSRLSVLGAALTLLLALAMPLVFHLHISSGSIGRWQLLIFLVFLSTLPGFMLAGRRPFAGSVWLLAAGATIGWWLVNQLVGPYYMELLRTPTFWPADLPIVGGIIFLFAAFVTKRPISTTPKVDPMAHWKR